MNRAPATTSGLRSITTFRFSVALAYGLLLAFLAAAPSLPDAGIEASDKVIHGVAYGIQALLLVWAIGDRIPRPRSALMAWLGATTLGLATEVLQLFQPMRSAQLGDLAADTAGAAFMMSAVLMVRAYSINTIRIDIRRTAS